MITSINAIWDKYKVDHDAEEGSDDFKSQSEKLEMFKKASVDKNIDKFYKRVFEGNGSNKFYSKGAYWRAIDKLHSINPPNTNNTLTSQQAHEVVYAYLEGAAEGHEVMKQHLDAFKSDFNISDDEKRTLLYQTFGNTHLGKQTELEELAEEITNKTTEDIEKILEEYVTKHTITSSQFERKRIRADLFTNQDLGYLVEHIREATQNDSYEPAGSEQDRRSEIYGVLELLYDPFVQKQVEKKVALRTAG